LIERVVRIAVALPACLLVLVACRRPLLVLPEAPMDAEPGATPTVDAGGSLALDAAEDAAGEAAADSGVESSTAPEGGSIADSMTSDACSDDLTSDKRNCGVCGHSCLGGACVLGRCGSWVIDDAGDVTQLATDSNYIAWTDGTGDLDEVSQTGASLDRTGAALVPAAGAGPVLGAETLAWVSPVPSIVESSEATAGAGTLAATVPTGTAPRYLGLSADATHGWFLASSSDGVDLFGCPLTGSSPTCSKLVTVASSGTPGGLVVTTRLVFSLVLQGPASTIICYDLLSGGYNPSFATLTGPGPMASDGVNLYWASGSSPSIVINYTGVDGGPVQTLASGISGAVTALATDGTKAYYTTTDGESAILWVAPIDGSALPEKLYAGAGTIPGIAIAGNAVYFADVASGSTASQILGVVP
jgi:hypothetical protein